MNPRPAADLRLPILAVSAWSSAILTGALPAQARMPVLGCALAVFLGILRGSRRGQVRRTASAVALLWLVVAIGVTVRGTVVHDSWVAMMARDHAVARLVVEVRGDPKVHAGRDEDRATVRASVMSIEARGRRSSAPISVLLALPAADAATLQFGATYAVTARLEPALLPDSAATAAVRSHPQLLRQPGLPDRAAARLRDAIQSASRGQTSASGLVPALVDGDERDLPGGLDDDFKTAGLTHMLAVSGTNFVLLGSAWLALAAWCGVRGRAQIPIGLLGILGLVVVARAEPSVIRAALMGGIALIGLGQAARSEGVRALSACICVVMVFDPDLARSPGFALSALATGGILLLAGGWRDALMAWMPGFLAEAIAVTLAAYVACTPLVVALSGRMSLVAVPANLAAGVAVGPATVLGFLGGFVSLVAPALGRVLAAPATWCASWIVGVAHVAAGLPHPDVGLGPGSILLAGVVLTSVVLASVLGWVLRRPLVAVPVLLMSLVASTVTVPGAAWPPADWALVACDVGHVEYDV